MSTRRPTMLLLATLTVPCASVAHAAKVPTCAPERWVVQTPAPIITPPAGQVTGTEVIEYTTPGRQVSLALSSCQPALARLKGTKAGTQVVALYRPGSCPGITGPLRLRATIRNNCTLWDGSIKYPKQRKVPFTAGLSQCGDGVVDAGNQEACDGAGTCTSGATCNANCDCEAISGSTTTTTRTTTTVTSTTRASTTTTTTTRAASTSTSTTRTTTTTRPPMCGNNVKEGTEQCDGSSLGGAFCAGSPAGGFVTCNANCTLNFDTCSTTTTRPPTTTTSTTTTTTRATSTSTTTTTTTQPAPVCGNGIKEGTEECDGSVGNVVCPGSGGGAFVTCVTCTLNFDACSSSTTTVTTRPPTTTTSTTVTTTRPPTTTTSTTVTTTRPPTTTTSTTVTTTRPPTTTTSTTVTTTRPPTTTTSTTVTTTRPPTTTTSTTVTTTRPPTTTTSTTVTTTRPPTTTTSTTVTTTRPPTTTTSTTVTTTTTSITTTTGGGGSCPTQLHFATQLGTSQCGGAAFNPVPVAPFSGTLYSDTTCSTRLNDLGLGCLYLGGGGNSRTGPNQNPDGPNAIFAVTSCTGNVLTLGPQPGPLTTCTQGPAATLHCAKNPTLACATNADCEAQGLGPFCVPDARCLFGPPLPVPALGNESCVLNVIAADATGTIDQVTGAASLNLQLSSRTYLTANAGSPCPRCVGGRCNAGKNVNQPCTPVGSKGTTAECPPLDGSLIGALPISLNPLRTTPDVVRTAATGVFCPPQPPVAGQGQTTAGAFGKVATRCIVERGTSPGDLSTGQTRRGTLATIFCIPATSNTVVNGVVNIPGPGATSIHGDFRLVQ